MPMQNLSPKPPGTIWVLVASAQSAHFYILQKTETERPSSWTRRNPLISKDEHVSLVPLPDMDFKVKTQDVYDDPAAGHTTTPYRNLHKMTEEDFARDVAKQLEKSLAEAAFDHLTLVAPPRFIGLLKKELSAAVQKTILAEVPKNLIQNNLVNEQEVIANVKATIPIVLPT